MSGSDYTSVVPSGFAIADSAKAAIAECLKQCDLGQEWVPAICWAHTLSGPENLEVEHEGPGIGVYEISQIPREAILDVSGIELVFALTKDNKKFFDNKTLHYRDGDGFLLL